MEHIHAVSMARPAPHFVVKDPVQSTRQGATVVENLIGKMGSGMSAALRVYSAFENCYSQKHGLKYTKYQVQWRPAERPPPY